MRFFNDIRKVIEEKTKIPVAFVMCLTFLRLLTVYQLGQTENIWH